MDRLQSARERAAARDAIAVKLAAARGQSRVRRQSLEESEARLSREDEDVRRLEGATLTALFASMLGSKEQRLSKERAEALQARLSRDAARETLTRLEEDERMLSAGLAEFGGVDEELSSALAAKEASLVASGSPSARRLADIDAALAAGRASIKELSEAIVAADGALHALRRVESALDSARNWGTFDLLGGGMIATYAKHSRMDDARSAAHAAQIEGFAKFADYFFDGLIVDWLVQSKITSSRENVQSALRRVQDARSRLIAQKAELDREAQALGEDRRRIVESA
jgi:hypothetical protein